MFIMGPCMPEIMAQGVSLPVYRIDREAQKGEGSYCIPIQECNRRQDASTPLGAPGGSKLEPEVLLQNIPNITVK